MLPQPTPYSRNQATRAGCDLHPLTHGCSAGNGINTFDITNPAGILPLKTQAFPVPPDNGTAPQNKARPHEAILDPTGNFLVFPDLGADLLRVMRVDKKTLQYTELVRPSLIT